MKHLLKMCILLSFVGCTEVAINENMNLATSEEYYAVIEGGNTRTYVDEQIRMRWTAEDCITIFEKETYNRKFMFTGKTGDNAGGFTKVSVDDNYYSAYDVDANYAIYPHSDDNSLDETDLFFTLDMPAEQTYAENSFGLGANTMVAVSETNKFIFKNVSSYLRVRLYGDNTSVSSITLTNKGNEAISGKAKITPSMDADPTCVMTGSGKSIRLTCPTPITISSDADAPTNFWIVVPPVTLASGFTVTVENSDGNTQTFDVNQSFTFERNKYNDMLREVEIDNIPTVRVTEAGTLSTLIPENEKYTITSLKVSGPLNGTDFKYIREMGGVGDADDGFHANTGGKLVYLDLSGASIVEGGSEYVYYKGEYASNPGGDYYYTSNNTVSVFMFGRTYIESIILPNSVTLVANNAFAETHYLKSLTILNSATSFDNYSFSSISYNCPSLETIYCYATTPPSIGQIESFGGRVTLYVPKGCKAVYDTSDWANYFSNIVEME